MRKIFVAIERRADYSRFRPIIFRMKKDPFFKVYLVVTGICLLKKHGKDINYIKEDGFKIAAKIPMFKYGAEDSGDEMVRAMSRFMYRVVDELERIKPDMVLSGFDTGGQLAVTIAAAHMNIPVAHIQGGELTGSIDESIRHAMCKFAHIHFPATELSRKRLIAMGEDPKRIFVVGCPSIENLINTRLLPKKEMEAEFGVNFSQPVALLIQHPVTTENERSFAQIEETLAALEALNLQTIVMLPNHDAGYSSIVKKIKSSKFRFYPSLPAEKYANLLRHARVLVGNSSSGIHETATFKIPVVNIGTRQQGRERPNNVIDVPYNKKAIIGAVKKALYDKKFATIVRKVVNPYGDGKASGRIVKIMKTVSLKDIIQKKFFDS